MRDAALLDDLSTPALLVDEARLIANIERMRVAVETAGVRMRPHAKTHKCAEIARRQVEAGAVGLTVATVAEAEAFAEVGVTDLVIATPVAGAPKLTRLHALIQNDVRLAVTVDTEAGARHLAQFFASRGASCEVFVEVDTGHHRNGIPWDAPRGADLVHAIASLPRLHVRGLLTHGGHAYAGPEAGETPEAARRRAMETERDRLLTFASRLKEASLLTPETAVLSLGSTPTASVFENAEKDGFRITEIRPGNAVFHDMQQVALGSATPNDCALTVLARVISKRRSDGGTERVIVDAGKKILTTDMGYGVEGHGRILYSADKRTLHPHARVANLSEEHGWVDTPGGATFDVSDLVQIIPNHACVAVATQPTLHLVRGDEVVETWDVLAR